MEHEIELKFLTNEQAGEMIEKKLLPQLDASITQETQILTNHYFDTANRTLRQHKIGLRVRGNNQKFEQTIKTAGKSIGGLHHRLEYNVQLDESNKQSIAIPDLRLFPLSLWPKTIDVDDLQTKIKTLFTTHFERKLYLLEFSHGDIVELVWDRGDVKSGNKSVPICEIELELKKGTTKALFNLAKQIVSLLPIFIGTDSKAARGYNLLDGIPVNETRQYQTPPAQNIKIDAAVFTRLLTTQLQDFQIFSAEIRHNFCAELAINVKHVLIALVDNLEGFSHHFPCPPLTHIHMQLKTLANEWSKVTENNDKNAANSLLARAQTTQLQLDIVQCLVEQSWSSNV